MEAFGREVIVGQGAAEPDVLRQVPAGIGLERLEQHAGKTDRVGFGLQLLPVGHDYRGDAVSVAQAVDMLHPVGQEPAGAAGRVVERADAAGVVDEHLVVGVQQQLDGQVDHVARRHEVFRRLVHLGPELADQVFVDVGHDTFGDLVGVQRDRREVLADLVEHPGLVHLRDGVREIELFENHPRVRREAGDVILEVGAGPGPAQRAEAVVGGVVERVAGQLAQDEVHVEPLVGHGGVGLAHLLPGGFEHAFEAAQQREGQDDLAELGVPERAPEVVGVLPDEIREGGVGGLGVHFRVSCFLFTFPSLRGFRLTALPSMTTATSLHILDPSVLCL